MVDISCLSWCRQRGFCTDMASLHIPASQLPAINAVVSVLVNRYGTVENIPDGEWDRLLPSTTARAVKTIITTMDCAYPSPAAVMQAVVECAFLPVATEHA